MSKANNMSSFWCSFPAAAAKSLQSCPALCDPIDGSPPGSPVPGILQARTLEWVAIAFSNAWKWKVKVKSLSSCPTLCDPMDCSPPGSSVHGIFQPQDWKRAVFIPIPKKGNANECSNYCTIAHISHASKIISSMCTYIPTFLDFLSI